MTGGCAVLQPHIDVPAPGSAAGAPAGFAGDLGAALAEAGVLRGRYEAAVGDYALARNSLAGLLIPLSAASLAVGISGSSQFTRDFLLGAGAGGAAAYALGSTLIEQPRQRIYLAGARAVTCAMLATRPLQFPTSDYPTALQIGVARLHAAIEAAAMAGVDATLVSQARTIESQALALLEQMETAGFTLRQQLHAINADVSEQIVRTEPDLASIMAAAGSLRTVAAGVAPGFPAAPRGLQANLNETPAAAQAAAGLADAVAIVMPYLLRAQAGVASDDQIAACTLAGSGVLRLGLTANVVDVPAGTTFDVPVLSPILPVVAVSGPPSITATKRLSEASGVVIAVTVAAGATGEATVFVTDPASGAQRTFVVRAALPAAGRAAPRIVRPASPRPADFQDGPGFGPPIVKQPAQPTVKSDPMLHDATPIVPQSDPPLPALVPATPAFKCPGDPRCGQG